MWFNSCMAGKSHASPHPPRTTSYAPLALVFVDIWGLSTVLSHQGYSYYVNFIDAATNFNWVFPMVRKLDMYKVFNDFYKWAERQFGKKLHALQTDNTLELRKLGKHLAELGISHRMLAPYSHQQMGHVERCHRNLMDTTITMINHAKLPPSMWDFIVLTTCYLTPILQGSFPPEPLFSRTSEYNKLRDFGCKCYPCLRPYLLTQNFLGHRVNH